jgi:hypothetical protein
MYFHSSAAGGTAATAPEGGAHAGPSAPTSTSTRWAMATLYMCHAWHGRGLNEVPAAAIHVIKSCGEAMYGGFWKSKYPYPNTRISRSATYIYIFRDWILAYTLPTRERGRRVRNILWREGGTDGSSVGRGCWTWRQTARKQRHGKALANKHPAR